MEIGDRVEKFTGEARWFGIVKAIYPTSVGGTRVVVEVAPQGFQMIATPAQLRPVPDSVSFVEVYIAHHRLVDAAALAERNREKPHA